MPILQDILLQMDLADVWKYETGGREPRASLRVLGQELMAESQGLIAPRAIFDFFTVQELRHNRMVLAGGQSLNGPDVGRLLGKAEEIAIGIATIGPALEERIGDHFKQDEAAHAYLLDVIGTLAVVKLTQQVCAHIATLAEARGLACGFPLSPGDTGWPITQQRVLFECVPGEEIGVRLTDTLMMLPQKSVSFVVGLGHGLLSADQTSQCDYCSIQQTCRYRERKQTTRTE